MKKILIFISLVIATSGFSYGTHEEINALTVNKVLFHLLHTAYPDCRFKIMKDKPREFEFLVNVTGTPECAATLPTLETTLENYKTEQHALLTYRTVLQEKKAEAKALYKTIRPRYHKLRKKAGLPPVSNPDAVWERDQVERVNLHTQVDVAINHFNLLNGFMPEVLAEDTAKQEITNTCNINVNVIQNFDVETIDGMDITQLKGVLKYMARIIKCRIK